jgi:hypothetical protein
MRMSDQIAPAMVFLLQRLVIVSTDDSTVGIMMMMLARRYRRVGMR